MDIPVAPTIVLERPAPCSDADKAEEWLRRVLAPSEAPEPAWTVTVDRDSLTISRPSLSR